MTREELEFELAVERLVNMWLKFPEYMQREIVEEEDCRLLPEEERDE